MNPSRIRYTEKIATENSLKKSVKTAQTQSTDTVRICKWHKRNSRQHSSHQLDHILDCHEATPVLQLNLQRVIAHDFHEQISQSRDRRAAGGLYKKCKNPPIPDSCPTLLQPFQRIEDYRDFNAYNTVIRH